MYLSHGKSILMNVILECLLVAYIDGHSQSILSIRLCREIKYLQIFKITITCLKICFNNSNLIYVVNRCSSLLLTSQI